MRLPLLVFLLVMLGAAGIIPAIAQWEVTAAVRGTKPPPPPKPTGFVPTSKSVADTTGGNVVIATLTVSMSNGIAFNGTCSDNDPSALTTIAATAGGCNLKSAASGYSSANDGTYSLTINVCQAGQCLNPGSPNFILTITGNGGLTAPPQAVAAGFTTLMFNLDFTGATQSQVRGVNFNQATLSNWWDCAGAGSPFFYNYLAGQAVITCSGISSIISDIDNGPLGTGGSVNVLQVRIPDRPNGGNVSMSTTDGGNPPTGVTSPSAFYAEARFRTDAASDASMLAAGNGASMIDFWTFAAAINGAAYSEWDFIELNAGGDDLAQVRNGCVSCFGPGFNYPSTISGWDHDVYNTIGYRNTIDGLGHVEACIYSNGVQVWCSGVFDSGNGVADPNITAEPAQLMFTVSNNNAGGFDNGYLEYFRAWSCPSWNNVNSSPYNGNTCAGSLLGTGQ